jgi:hypothetical protein
MELCKFCDDHETQEHLFFLCPLAKYFCSVVSVSLAIDTLPECFTYLYAHTRRDRKASVFGCSLGCLENKKQVLFSKNSAWDPTNVVFFACQRWIRGILLPPS